MVSHYMHVSCSFHVSPIGRSSNYIYFTSADSFAAKEGWTGKNVIAYNISGATTE